MTIQSVSSMRENVMASIRRAAESHKVDFDYLLNQAKIESGLNPSARAGTSSATGLYQFTAGTWLNVIKRHGDKVGLSSEADALRSDSASPAQRARILALRQEPEVSAHLAARFALDNAQALSTAGHKSLGATELYLAHFLGAGGATTFLDGLRKNPSAPAANVLPAAASANTRIFYEGRTPRSFQEIYDRFAAKFGTTVSTAVAQAPEVTGAPNKVEAATQISNEKIKQIVTKVMAPQPSAGTPDNSQTPVAGTTAEAPLPAEMLEIYLRNFSLVDHERGFTPTTPATREASRSAGVHANEAMDGQSGFGQIGLGARLVLKAADSKPD